MLHTYLWINLSMKKILIVLPIILFLLTSCGGGSGGSGGSTNPSVSYDSSQITLNISGITTESSQ